MKVQLLQLLAVTLAGMIVMIMHELPKSVVYQLRNTNGQNKAAIFKVWQYIDPIGLLFCVTTTAGFSKPYMYRIKEMKTNLLLGITGIVTLIVMFVGSTLAWKELYPVGASYTYSTTIEWVVKMLPNYIIQYISVLSINMLLVNLVPISTFDIGLIVAGKSPSKYFSIIKNDYMIKMILIMIILFGVISNLSGMILHALIAV